MNPEITAEEILGNPEYQAFSFGGYRGLTRDSVPSVNELKEGLRILSALNIKMLRTYNTQQYAHAANLLQAIRELKHEHESFEMYVMLGTWIECEGAWTDHRNHEAENLANNEAEIHEAVRLANEYSDIVKVIAVGNEAMVHWAETYFVAPGIVLKWVNHLQELKKNGGLSKDLWITSSDNFASWGGGESSYHKPELVELVKAVDFVSMHTYPYHDTHYNPSFWIVENDSSKTEIEKVEASMVRARDYAISQYESVVAYVGKIDPEKPIHIGETGWSSKTNDLYGDDGSKASDEYKQKLYYDLIREWTNENGVSCFYFEIFDEQWKDMHNPLGSENHFGLITLKGEAKFALWDHVDSGAFEGLERNGYPIKKSFNGYIDELVNTVHTPAVLELTEN